MAKSTYNAAVLRYFQAYKRHPAVLAARALPFISCDYPVRLSWAFYDYPRLKLATMQPQHMDGYEDLVDLNRIQAYFQACQQFYQDTNFQRFYQAQAPEYARWVADFERVLYQDSLLATLDNFYRLKRDRPVAITLGALNCGSYAMSDLRGINPNSTQSVHDYGGVQPSYAGEKTRSIGRLLSTPRCKPRSSSGTSWATPIWRRYFSSINKKCRAWRISCRIHSSIARPSCAAAGPTT